MGFGLRIARKLPVDVDRRLHFSALLVAMLRLRGDRERWQSLPFRRMVKRAVHIFSQHVDDGLAGSLLEECPLPDVAARYHPYMRGARLRGNKSLEMGLVNKFMARGGGFVTARHEVHLGDLSIISRRSALAQRTSSEYVARNLLKQKDFLEEALKKQVLRTVNVCFDAATVCQEQAACCSLV